MLNYLCDFVVRRTDHYYLAHFPAHDPELLQASRSHSSQSAEDDDMSTIQQEAAHRDQQLKEHLTKRKPNKRQRLVSGAPCTEMPMYVHFLPVRTYVQQGCTNCTTSLLVRRSTYFAIAPITEGSNSLSSLNLLSTFL
jgi:hypothetical protein